MANSAGSVAIYPAGRGHYALGSPDGKVLDPGQPLTVLVAGHQVNGIIQASDLGDYLRAEDGTICGLCASMRMVSLQRSGIDGQKLGAWVRHDRCWIDQQDGEALVGHRLALFRLSAHALPDWLQPATDDMYEYSAYDGHVLREEEEKARWIRMHWQNALVASSLCRCTPTDQIDRPEGLRYRALVDSDGITRWISARILETFAPTLARLAAYRFELIAHNRFRVYAPDDATPVAIVSERVKPEVVK